MEEEGEGKALIVTQMTVSIMALRVGKKQVTQSVFKQLPYGEPFDKNGEPKGVLWGWINYCPCSWVGHSARKHRHIVFMLSGELFRGSAFAPSSYTNELCVENHWYSPLQWHGETVGPFGGFETDGPIKKAWETALALPQLFIAV